jgi:hypothetical protein
MPDQPRQRVARLLDELRPVEHARQPVVSCLVFEALFAVVLLVAVLDEDMCADGRATFVLGTTDVGGACATAAGASR